MSRVKKSVSESKSLSPKEKIINVSRYLFLTLGYEKTTIRKILQETGLTTGSLYHFFKDKEEILLEISKEAFHEAGIIGEILSAEQKNQPLIVFSLAFSIPIILSHMNERIAELFLIAHNSWKISKALQSAALERNQKLLCEPLGIHFSPEELFVLSLSSKGCVHNLISETVYEKKLNLSLKLKLSLEVVFNIFGVPKNFGEGAISETLRVASSKRKVFQKIIDQAITKKSISKILI